jgi:protease I
LWACLSCGVGTRMDMTSPPDPDMTTSEQLDEDELAADPLERGMEPPDDWSAAGRFGTTPREEREGESLAERLAEEEPET